jgi:hypothetical protein
VLRFQSYIELFYVAWERAHMTKAAGVLSPEVFDLWNDWFLSVAKRDPAFVWPMVRGSQHLNPDFVQHVNESLGNMNSGAEDE